MHWRHLRFVETRHIILAPRRSGYFTCKPLRMDMDDLNVTLACL